LVDVLSKLTLAQYKGVQFPITSVDFGFSQEQAEHKFIFRDEALIQQLGRKNKTWRLEIPFLENLGTFMLDYKELYTKIFPNFVEVCQERTPGILTVPDVGNVRVACASLQYTISSEHRDGVIVRVEFISAPLANDAALIPQIPSVQAIAAQAKKLDTAVAATNFNPPTSHAVVPQETPASFSDPFTAVSSVFDQLSNSRKKNLAKIDDTTARINKMNASIDRISDPKLWSVKRQALDLKNALNRAATHSDSKGKRLKQAFVNHPTPTNVMATKLHITLSDLLRLNPELSQQPIIPANTVVRYYVVG